MIPTKHTITVELPERGECDVTFCYLPPDPRDPPSVRMAEWDLTEVLDPDGNDVGTGLTVDEEERINEAVSDMIGNGDLDEDESDYRYDQWRDREEEER